MLFIISLNFILLIFQRIYFAKFIDTPIEAKELDTSICFGKFSISSWSQVEQWVELYRAKNWTFNVIQVGANDGNSDDFQKLLQERKASFKAILIEP